MNKYNNRLVMRQKAREAEKNIDEEVSSKEKAVYLLLVMLLAVVYYVFFNNGRAGISMLIFVAMAIGVFFYINKSVVNIKSPAGIFALSCLMVICLGCLLNCNRLAAGLNMVAVPMLLTGGFIMFRYPQTQWGSWSFVGNVLERIVITPLKYIGKPLHIIRGKRRSSDAQSHAVRKSIMKGMLIGVPTLLVVLELLSSADMVYGYYLSSVGSYIRIENAGDAAGTVIKILVLFILFFAYLYSFKYNIASIEEREEKAGSFDRIMSITMLAPLVIVYIIFIGIQAYYLFGREGLPDGFTYAEYARQGFFQLLVVTAINLMITSLIMHFSRKSKQYIGIILKILLSFMVLCTLFMLFSSSYKLSMYEHSYGFTYLRFYVHCFIIMLFLLMLLVGVGVWLRKIDVLKGCFVCAIVFYCMLTLISPDSFIARNNIARYNETGKMDVAYLKRLSPDAVPYIRDFIEENKDPRFNELKVWVSEQEKRVQQYKWYEMNLPLYRLSNMK